MKWYWNHKRFYWIDLIISGCGAVGVILATYFYSIKLTPTETTYSAIAGLAGALLGFLIAALTVLVGLIREDGMTMLRESGHSDIIIDIFHSTLGFLGITTLVAIIPLFNKEIGSTPLFIACTVFFLFACVARLQKCVWILMRIIKINYSRQSREVEWEPLKAV